MRWSCLLCTSSNAEPILRSSRISLKYIKVPVKTNLLTKTCNFQKTKSLLKVRLIFRNESISELRCREHCQVQQYIFLKILFKILYFFPEITRNTASVAPLFFEFVHYYLKFQFRDHYISICNARVMDRWVFLIIEVNSFFIIPHFFF